MKVFEILRTDVVALSDQEIVSRLKSFDWGYEFKPHNKKTLRELELLENIIYQKWKKNPDRAVKLWNENVPYSPDDKSTVPSFIFRLQSQDI